MDCCFGDCRWSAGWWREGWAADGANPLNRSLAATGAGRAADGGREYQEFGHLTPLWSAHLAKGLRMLLEERMSAEVSFLCRPPRFPMPRPFCLPSSPLLLAYLLLHPFAS